MTENRLDFIAEHFSAYLIRFSEDNRMVEISNSSGGEPVRVEYVPEDEFTPFIVYFSFQHRHMSDEEDIIEYISDVIDGNVLSIEFFKDGENRFGGDIEAQKLQELSYESLTEYFPIGKLIEEADSFKVRGWRREENFDAKFVVDACGAVTVEKL